VDPRINQLLERLAEVSDDQLADFGDVLTASLESAADAKNITEARSLSAALDDVRRERRQRDAARHAGEAELSQILVRQGLADAPEPEPETEDAGALVASLRSTPSIAALAAARNPRNRARPRVEVGESRWRTPAGNEFTTTADLADEILTRLRTFTGGRVPIATARWELPEDRQLGGDMADNLDRIAAVVSPAALVASGGACAPVAPSYDFPSSATGTRPLRDGLPRFDGSRGGIIFLPAPTLAAVAPAVGITTHAEDVSSENYPKPCLSVVCEDPTELRVQAVHRCLEFSNFNARTHPESVAEYLTLAIANVARAAEDSLWSLMVASSTAVTSGEGLSATRDVLAAVARAAAAIRSRHRMPQDFPMRWAAPAWMIDLMQTDMGRQQPGDNSMGITRADIERWLGARAIRPIWSLDSGTQVFGPQAAGGLNPWLSTVETLVYAEGSFIHVDAGELDLGIVRDATLNSTNDLQIWSETFETVAFVGVESLALTLDLCPSGVSAGQLDDYADTVCVVGS